MKLGGYIIEERGLVNMKGKGEVRTFWLVGHVEGKLHRRESLPDEYLQLPITHQLINDLKKKSPKGLPRKGSLVAFKNDNEGSIMNVNNSKIPAFLRLKEASTLKTNSPKHAKKILRHSKNMSRDRMNDSYDILSNYDKPQGILRSNLKLKNSSSLLIHKPIPSPSNIQYENNINFKDKEFEYKHESLMPLITNEENIICENVQHDNSMFDSEHEIIDQLTKHSQIALRRKFNKNGVNPMAKKWHSCSEIGCDSIIQNNITTLNKNNSFINSTDNQFVKNDGSLRDWFIGFMKTRKFNSQDNQLNQRQTDNNKINNQKNNQQINETLILNSISLNEFADKIESTV